MNVRHILSTIFVILLLAGCGRAPESEGGTNNDSLAMQAGEAMDEASMAIDSLAARRFEPAFVTVEDLLHAFLEAVAISDKAALRSLLVNEREFNNWLWPEFPMSDPAMNVPEGFAWRNLEVKSDKGLRRTIRAIGGKSLKYKSIHHVDEEERYKTFTVRGGTRIDVVDEKGNASTLSFVGSVVELNGTFKFMSYRE